MPIFLDNPSPSFTAIDAIGIGANWPQLRATLNVDSAKDALLALMAPKPDQIQALKTRLQQTSWRYVMPRKSNARPKPSPAPEVDEIQSPQPSSLGGNVLRFTPRGTPRGTGFMSAGQSGDLQGLSDTESADAESVAELTAEGQYHEAEIVSALEDAADEDPEKDH
jgi:hypothetical protein